MLTKFVALLVLVSLYAYADENVIGGPFGSKPLSLTINDGIKLTSARYVCSLEAINGKYSEWGATENDARGLVMATCKEKSGLLLCSRDKVTCKQE